MATGLSLSEQRRRNFAASKVNGGGGGGGVDIQQILDMLAAGTNKANKANQARLDELRGGNAARREEALRLLNGLGVTEGRLIEERGQQRIAQQGQDLVSRGLSGTTIKQSGEQAINRDTQTNQTLLAERVASQKLGTLDQISRDKQGFIERVTDKGPDANVFAGLLQQLGINQAQQPLTGAQRAQEQIDFDRVIQAEKRRNAAKTFGLSSSGIGQFG